MFLDFSSIFHANNFGWPSNIKPYKETRNRNLRHLSPPLNPKHGSLLLHIDSYSCFGIPEKVEAQSRRVDPRVYLRPYPEANLCRDVDLASHGRKHHPRITLLTWPIKNGQRSRDGSQKNGKRRSAGCKPRCVDGNRNSWKGLSDSRKNWKPWNRKRQRWAMLSI